MEVVSDWRPLGGVGGRSSLIVCTGIHDSAATLAKPDVSHATHAQHTKQLDASPEPGCCKPLGLIKGPHSINTVDICQSNSQSPWTAWQHFALTKAQEHPFLQAPLPAITQSTAT